MTSALQKYIESHSSPQSEALSWLERQTNIRTNYPRMLSGAVQGKFLEFIVRMCSARRVLEIGTFTGYSAICLAFSLPEGGIVDTLEINDELEDLTREGWDRAGVSSKIRLHIGNALEILPGLDPGYDIAYIDANKREYSEYYEMILPLMKQGGVILVDDVMLGGKVYEDNPSCDKQTQGLLKFNDLVASDSRVETVMLPIRDGLSIIMKK